MDSLVTNETMSVKNVMTVHPGNVGRIANALLDLSSEEINPKNDPQIRRCLTQLEEALDRYLDPERYADTNPKLSAIDSIERDLVHLIRCTRAVLEHIDEETKYRIFRAELGIILD